MDPHEYLRLQLRLEGKEIVRENLLRQVEAVPGEDLPLMIVALLENQKQVAYYSEALPTVLFEELILCSSAVRFPKIGSIIQFLDLLDIRTATGHYKTYIFPNQYTSFASKDVREYHHTDPVVRAFGFDGFAEKVYAIDNIASANLAKCLNLQPVFEEIVITAAS